MNMLYPTTPEPRTRCTECGAEWDCDDDVPLLYDAVAGEHYHGCPQCNTDAYLLDIPRGPAPPGRP